MIPAFPWSIDRSDIERDLQHRSRTARRFTSAASPLLAHSRCLTSDAFPSAQTRHTCVGFLHCALHLLRRAVIDEGETDQLKRERRGNEARPRHDVRRAGFLECIPSMPRGQRCDVLSRVVSACKVPIQHAYDAPVLPKNVFAGEISMNEGCGVALESCKAVRGVTGRASNCRVESRDCFLDHDRVPARAAHERVRLGEVLLEWSDGHGLQRLEQFCDAPRVALARSVRCPRDAVLRDRDDAALGDGFCERSGYGERQLGKRVDYFLGMKGNGCRVGAPTHAHRGAARENNQVGGTVVHKLPMRRRDANA